MPLFGISSSRAWTIFLVLCSCALVSGEVSDAEAHTRDPVGPITSHIDLLFGDLQEVIGHLEGKLDCAVHKMEERLSQISDQISTEIEDIKSEQVNARAAMTSLWSLIDAKLEVQELKMENKLGEVSDALEVKIENKMEEVSGVLEKKILEIPSFKSSLDRVASSIGELKNTTLSLCEKYTTQMEEIQGATERLMANVGALLNHSTEICTQRVPKYTCPLATVTQHLTSAFSADVPFTMDMDGRCFLGRPVDVPACFDVTPSGERWLVFLRRVDGSLDFNGDWSAYGDGFGDWEKEFWLGNRLLHKITQRQKYRLRVEMTDWSGEEKMAEYSEFRVGPESEGFRLTVTGYLPTSTAGDAMGSQNGMKFSTRERDQDTHPGNCASAKRGGWWYRDCGLAYPTAWYLGSSGGGVGNENTWYPAYRDWRSFEGMILSIRPTLV